MKTGCIVISAVAVDDHGLQSAIVHKKVNVQNNEPDPDPDPEPEKNPDLTCEGTFSWTDIKPEATLNGSFIVKNIGDAGSILNWTITEYPNWGTWYFTPSNADNVTPEDGIVTINVEVIAPDTTKNEFFRRDKD